MHNSISTLTAKDQFIIREILDNGCFNSLLRYDYDKMKQWNSLFNTNKDVSADTTWTQIQLRIRMMIKNNILKYTTSFLKADLSPSGRQMQVRTYDFKNAWKANNKFELNQMHERFATKAQRIETAYKKRTNQMDIRLTRFKQAI